MARVAITEQYLTDIADAIRSKTGSSTTYLPSEMAPAILTISGSGGITPTGTIPITENGTYNVTNYASAEVSVPTGSTINNQNKSVTPTESSQSITYDTGYTGLGTVTVGAISSTYVGSGITTNPTPTASGATVTIPAGYYSTQTTKSVDSGTAGTPTASKGTVSNHAVSVTPSVTNTAGYISGGTKTGTAVTVSASELVSGNKAINSNGTNIDVTNYATVSVSVPTGSTISNQDKTVNPSTSQQQITADEGYTGLGIVTITAMPSLTLPISVAASATSGYTKKATVSRSTSTQYINIGTGYNAAGGYYEISAVANGTEGTPTATKGTVSNHSISVTPSVTNTAGYISGGTKTGTAVSVSASELVSGNKSISANGTNIDVTNYATVSVSVPTGSTISNQDKTVTSSGTLQTITYDSGYTGLGTVTINAAPSADISSSFTGVYSTVNGARRWTVTPSAYAETSGWVSIGEIPNATSTTYNAIAKNTTITPTESSQTIGGSDYMLEGAITINAISSDYVGSDYGVLTTQNLVISGPNVTVPVARYTTSEVTGTVSSLTLPTSTSSSATSGYTSKATITPSTSDQYINIGTGYNSTTSYYKISAMTTMTLPTSAAASATSGYTSKATISRSTSDQYINIPAGYNSTGAYYKISAVANGSATGPSTVSSTGASVSTGTNTLTLTKTSVSTTPTVSAGYVSSATSSTATVTLTASVTTKGATTYTPTTTNQTIASGTYLTGTQTISGDTNLIAGNIKKDVSIFGVTGSYEGSGGGGGETGMMVATKTATLSSAASSISFTGLSGEPTSFVATSSSDQTTGGTKVVAVAYDGTSVFGMDITTQMTNDTGFSQSYSNGTLTITATSASFQANEYKLVYSYGGTAENIGTASVQVGSGATSITFTGLEDEPEYFSCVFKSTFSTSSGYQRVVEVVYDGTSTYGHEMDSSAKYSAAHWSYTYNNGSLTITSQSTNAGGYFHQPGYYQLTYATEGEGGNYQSKTVYATSSQQVVQADSGYDALQKITIPAVTTTNLSASNILSGVTIQVGDAADSDRIASVTGNVVLQNYYTGSSTPSSSTGSNGDLYLQT